MKKVCTFLIALLLILSSLAFGTEQSEAASFRTVKVVTSSSLVVKASGSPSANTVATLSKGNFVTVFSTSNGWATIQSGNVRGHVNASFLKTPPSTIKIASSKSGLVVKTTPTKPAPTSATLKHNMIVEDFGSVGGGWSFVQYGNVTGYVATSFIGKPKTSTKYVNTASGVVVRNIASPSGANTGTLENRTQVTVHSTLAGWSYVTSGSTKGYVVSAFLSTTQLPPKAKTNNKQTNIGKTRNTAAKLNETVLVEVDDWLDGKQKYELTLTQVISGQEAWSMIEEANMFNDEPDVGMKYVLAKFKVKVHSLELEPFDINHAKFDAVSKTGSMYNQFFSVVTPNPDLSTDLYTGAEYEGWTYFMIERKRLAKSCLPK